MIGMIKYIYWNFGVKKKKVIWVWVIGWYDFINLYVSKGVV